MIRLPLVLTFVALTFLAWGSYGILLHHGQEELGKSSMRSFVGVGIAYFLVAVLVPAILMSSKPEKGKWTVVGTLMSLFAGVVGALGAFGVLLALKFGKPIYVMPLVFGLAPVVNTLVSTWLNKSFSQINAIFVVGILLVACGAVGVLVTKPAPPKSATPSHTPSATSNEANPNTSDATSAVSPTSEDPKPEGKSPQKEATPAPQEPSTSTASSDDGNAWKVVLSVLMAALCWGSYAPFLHLGQMRMGGSRLRPFFCVGMSYFIIAVVAPLAFLASIPEQGVWTISGMLWSIAAGSAGAIGALGIILAFNSGGKPIFVMPLVFGFAPVVNTMISVYLNNLFSQVTTEFLICLGIVVVGAVTVLIFAPKSKPHAPAITPPVPPN